MIVLFMKPTTQEEEHLGIGDYLEEDNKYKLNNKLKSFLY